MTEDGLKTDAVDKAKVKLKREGWAENDRGARSIREVWFADEAAEHGETFADLLKD